MISRRRFIRSSFVLSAGLFSGASFSLLPGCSTAHDFIQPVKKRKYLLADIHNHIMMNEWVKKSPVAVKSPLLAEFAKEFFDKTSTAWKSSYEAGIDLICTSHFNLFDEW